MDRRICERCGHGYDPTARGQRFCPPCAKVRQSDRARQRRGAAPIVNRLPNDRLCFHCGALFEGPRETRYCDDPECQAVRDERRANRSRLPELPSWRQESYEANRKRNEQSPEWQENQRIADQEAWRAERRRRLAAQRAST